MKKVQGSAGGGVNVHKVTNAQGLLGGNHQSKVDFDELYPFVHMRGTLWTVVCADQNANMNVGGVRIGLSTDDDSAEGFGF